MPTAARDHFDLPITDADPATATGYSDYVFEFLAYGPKLRALFEIADARPDCALVNAHAAILHLAFEGADGWTAAAPYLGRMKAAMRGISERESLFCAATQAWADRDFHTALAHLDTLTVRWPADLCAIKWGQYHAFNLGDQAALLRFGERANIVHENTPYVHGMIAFALEQNHRLDEAEDAGKLAVEIALDDAWAHHAVAHVYETRGLIDKGLKWMAACDHTWDGKGVFIREHNWWHTALFHLANGDNLSALTIFDQQLWGPWPEFPQEQIGAISLLWRLEMMGADVGERWQPIVEQVRAHANSHILPFHDLHYIFALSRAGDDTEATRFLNGMAAFADTQTGAARTTWQDTALPIARGLAAYNAQKFNDTIAAFEPALPNLQRIGGSHAQRQVFLDTFEFARNKAQRGSQAASR